jgi:hypothetical protein
MMRARAVCRHPAIGVSADRERPFGQSEHTGWYEEVKMVKDTVPQSAGPAQSADTLNTNPKGSNRQGRIACRAYELYVQRGRQDGRALEDWLRAERQLAGAASHS